MSLLVSIHDVAPPNRAAVERLWALCRSAGVTPALLVVPDWHGGAPLERHPDFVAWVRARVAEGAEVILHGERHDEVGRPRGWRDEWRAWGKTAREGECLTLPPAELAALVTRGLARLRALGLEPTGFIPPAWLMRDEARAALAATGLRFTETDTAVHLFPGDRRLPSPAVRWSGRTPFRARASALVAAARWRLQRHAALVRLALHPGDLAHPASAASVEREVARWTRLRPAIPYAALPA